jgi:hypothetical protein
MRIMKKSIDKSENMLRLVQEKGPITAPILAGLTGVSRQAVQMYMMDLVDKGQVAYIQGRSRSSNARTFYFYDPVQHIAQDVVALCRVKAVPTREGHRWVYPHGWFTSLDLCKLMGISRATAHTHLLGAHHDKFEYRIIREDLSGNFSFTDAMRAMTANRAVNVNTGIYEGVRF